MGTPNVFGISQPHVWGLGQFGSNNPFLEAAPGPVTEKGWLETARKRLAERQAEEEKGPHGDEETGTARATPERKS